jgi:hypothetical protein
MPEIRRKWREISAPLRRSVSLFIASADIAYGATDVPQELLGGHLTRTAAALSEFRESVTRHMGDRLSATDRQHLNVIVNVVSDSALLERMLFAPQLKHDVRALLHLMERYNT